MTAPALNPTTGYPIVFPVQLTLTPLPATPDYPSYTLFPSQNLFPRGGLYLAPII
jgi:hypothetical protein